MPTPSPTIVVMFSTKTDIVWNCAATATMPSAIVIERRIAGDLDVEPVPARQPLQRAADRLAEIGHHGAAHVVGARGRQGRDEKGGVAIGADERGFADGADGDHLADVRLATERSGERVEDRDKTGVGVTH